MLFSFNCVFFAFDTMGLAKRTSWNNAVTLASDSWFCTVHVTCKNRCDEVAYAVEGDRKGTCPQGNPVDPTRGNIAGTVDNWWHNEMRRRPDVAWAIGKTILMTFPGTFGAAMIARSLASRAGRRFAPFAVIRRLTRRLFDFVHGVDAVSAFLQHIDRKVHKARRDRGARFVGFAAELPDLEDQRRRAAYVSFIARTILNAASGP